MFIHKINYEHYKGWGVRSKSEYKFIGICWLALCVNDNSVIYFNSFGVEHISEENKKLTGNKNIITNVFRMQAYDTIMFGYFCIEFIDFMFKDKSLTEFTNLFLRRNSKSNDKVILEYFLK